MINALFTNFRHIFNTHHNIYLDNILAIVQGKTTTLVEAVPIITLVNMIYKMVRSLAKQIYILEDYKSQRQTKT